MSDKKTAPAEKRPMRVGVTRRDALRGLGTLAAGTIAAVVLPGCDDAKASSAPAAASSETVSNQAETGVAVATDDWTEDGSMVRNVQRIEVPMRSVEHQPGVTGSQQNLQAVAFDMSDAATRDDLVALLKTWTKYSENLCDGFPVDEPRSDKNASPLDSGETYDLGAAGLTVSLGFGATLFQASDGTDRYGLAAVRPERLDYTMPHFSGDQLADDECGGDLFLLIAAEDPKVAFHAARNLIRAAYGTATIRWNKVGYYHTLSPEGYAHADRDLFGFRDGTTAPSPEDEDYMEKCVWIQPDDDPHGELYAGGTYMMWRSFDMKIEAWDQQTLAEQERVIGRTKLEGIPLSGGEDETAEPDPEALDENGDPLIDPASHVGLFSSLRHSSGHTMFRWGWNFSNGFNAVGQLRAGMHTGGMARDPENDFYQFMRLWRDCDLTEYLSFTGSASWLMLPGLQKTQEYLGKNILEATATS